MILLARIACTALLTSACFAAPASAQQEAPWPSKPVRIIVPIAPGGATDILARLFATHYEKRFGQPFVVEARPGALSLIGTEAVVKSPSDGYTLLMTSIQVASEQVLNPAWPIQFDRDITAIAMFAGGGEVIVVPNSLPVRTLADLVAYSKANPGKLNQAESGGISTNLAIMRHRLQMGPVETILYKGTQDAIQAIITGDAHFLGSTVLTVAPLEKAGKLRILAYTERDRHPLIPQVQTVNEAMGISDFDASFWFLLAGPARLPAEIVTRVHGATQEGTATPEISSRLSAFGMRTLNLSSNEARDRVLSRIRLLEQYKAAGVKFR